MSIADERRVLIEELARRQQSDSTTYETVAAALGRHARDVMPSLPVPIEHTVSA